MSSTSIESGLNAVAAVSAMLAAIFWFLSAAWKLPPPPHTWGYDPSKDMFYQALQASARLNRWAAGLSGVSALCMSIATAIHR